MLLRLTRKAAAKLAIDVEPHDGETAAMTEWYVNLVVVERRQFFLFTHARTLFSCWAIAAGVKGDEISPHLRIHAACALRDHGFTDAEIAPLFDEGPDQFAKAADRGVLGSMVDFARLFELAAEDGGGVDHVGPREATELANDAPMRRLGMESPLRILRSCVRAGGN